MLEYNLNEVMKFEIKPKNVYLKMKKRILKCIDLKQLPSYILQGIENVQITILLISFNKNNLNSIQSIQYTKTAKYEFNKALIKR